MPNYAAPLSAVGSGLGASLGGVLGQIGGVLDAPRRALWGAVGLPESGAEALHQGFGMDPENALTKALGMGAEMLGDPLTYLGGFGGRTLGKLAGHGLEEAALARGPRYAGGVEKLLGSGIQEAGEGGQTLQKLLASPQLSGVLHEVPEGSRFLGGNNGLAFRTPQGDVARIGQEASRPALPEVLQPTRNAAIGDWRVERLPMAEQVGDRGVYQQSYQDLAGGIRQQGYHPADLHPGNVGLVGGQPKILDPGAVVPHPRTDPNLLRFAPEIQARQPGGFTNWMLNALGADSSMQQELARSAAWAGA